MSWQRQRFQPQEISFAEIYPVFRSSFIENNQPRTKTLTRTCFGDLVAARFPRFAALPIFTSGKVLRRYLWCHLLFGWALITLFVAGFPGIVQR